MKTVKKLQHSCLIFTHISVSMIKYELSIPYPILLLIINRRNQISQSYFTLKLSPPCNHQVPSISLLARYFYSLTKLQLTTFSDSLINSLRVYLVRIHKILNTFSIKVLSRIQACYSGRCLNSVKYEY